jgi:hypothetical protein
MRTRRLHERLAYVMRVGNGASVAYAAASIRGRLCGKKTLLRSGCALHAWLTLYTIRLARKLT